MIYIIFDTNVLFNSNPNYDEFVFNKNFNVVFEFLEKEKLTEKCTLLIPNIVIEELKQQQIEKFAEDYQKINELLEKQKNLYEMKWNISIEQYNNHLNNRIDERLRNLKIKIIEPCSAKAFSNILEKALKKLPPFEGIQKQSDKGFKDAVIWHSIIDYSINNLGSYLFYTTDKIFLNNLKYLLEDFKLSEYRRIQFVDSIDAIRENLLSELNLDSIINKYHDALQDIKTSGCLDVFFNEIEMIPDTLVVDDDNYHLRMIDYDLKHFRILKLFEDNSTIQVDAEIGIIENPYEFFSVIFEINLEIREGKWKAIEYEIISKKEGINEIELTII